MDAITLSSRTLPSHGARLARPIHPRVRQPVVQAKHGSSPSQPAPVAYVPLSYPPVRPCLGAPPDAIVRTAGTLPAWFSPPRADFPSLACWIPGEKSLQEVAPQVRAEIDSQVSQHGALLLRGLGLQSLRDAEALVQAMGYTPADLWGLGLSYSATDATAFHVPKQTPSGAFVLCPHRDFGINPQPPAKLLLFCEQGAIGGGGESFLIDGRAVARSLPTWVADRFKQHGGIRYTRCYPSQEHTTTPHVHSWQDHAHSADAQDAVRYFASRGCSTAWGSLGELLVSNVKPGVEVDPDTGEARCFYMNPLAFGHMAYADGTDIEPEMFRAVNTACWQNAVAFALQPGDLLAVDNRRVMHGRGPFEGVRKLFAARTAD